MIGDIRSLLARFGIGDNYSANDVELVHHMLARMHQHFGMARFKIGALLLAIKYKELWKGKARSFNEYLEYERIKPSAANQYMQVAEKFMFELKLDNEQLMSLSRISMTTLVRACEKITPGNAQEIIDLLEVLSDRDVRHALDDLESHRKPLHYGGEQGGKISPKVKRMMNEYYSLPNDLRVEFMQALHIKPPSSTQQGAVHTQPTLLH